MGKHVIDAADGPGFLVNRCNRPFALEALRLVQEGIATPEQVDRICRMAGGFRMGPFELMDLVGLDVGFAVSRSFYEQSSASRAGGRRRSPPGWWRPGGSAARAAAAGTRIRPAGRRIPSRRSPAAARARGDRRRRSAVAALARRGRGRAGWEVDAVEASAAGVIVGGATGIARVRQQPLLATRALAGPGRRRGRLPPAAAARPARRAHRPSRRPRPAALEAAEHVLRLARHARRARRRRPGLVLGRIVAQLVNEAGFALGEGVGSAADIDAGMMLGLNHPRGPLAWGDEIGPDAVLALLTGLQDEYREERYRPAPALVRAARTGTPLDRWLG